MPLTWSAAAAAAVILILLYFFYHPEKHPPAAVQTRERLPDTANGRLRVLEAEELIRLLKLEPVLANIKVNLGLSDENWRRDALPTLYAYIAFVQRLPASESHHHAGDGGLCFEPACDVQRVFAVFTHAQGEGFQAFQVEPRFKGAEAGADAAHQLVERGAVFCAFADDDAAPGARW